MASRYRIGAVSLLLLATCGALAVWALWPAARTVSPSAPDDDLDWIAAARDAGARGPWPGDVLVASPAAVYLASGRDRTLVMFPAVTGSSPENPGETLEHLDGEPTAMALGNGVLCLATAKPGRSEGSGAVRWLSLASRSSTVVASGLRRLRAIACDEKWIFAVEVDDAAPGLLRTSAVIRLATRPDKSVDANDPKVVMGRSDGEIAGLALDPQYVYWADSLDETIVRVPTSGGPPVVLATGRGLPRSLLVDGDALFWAEPRGEALWTMPKTGGTPTRIAQDFAGFNRVVANAHGVYWVNEAAVDGGYRVLRVPRAGGEVTSVSATVDAIEALATDGDKVYVARGGAISAIATAGEADR